MYVLSILIASTLFISCKSGYVDTIKKCSKDDNACLNNLYDGILRQIATEGIPEVGIPASDPMFLNNTSMNIIDSVIVTVVDGVAKGLKTCVYKNFNVNLDKKTGSLDLTCDFTVKGHIKFSGSSPIIQNLIGKSFIEGEGSGKIKIDKLHLALTFSYKIVKRDGEIYMRMPSNGIDYKFDAEKLSFNVEKVLIGNEDISPLVSAYVKENDKYLLKTFGKIFIDRALLHCFKSADLFLSSVPVSKLIIEDLSSFVNK